MRRVEPSQRASDGSPVLVVLGAVLVGVIAALLVLRFRSPPALIAPVASGTVDLSEASPGTTATIFVHVAGAVRRPGLYEVGQGARVAEAIDLAGGVQKIGDLDALNLAQIVTDGMRIDVPFEGDPSVPQPVSGASAGPSPISINSADAALLETVPGLGPVKAAAIVGYREQVGGFDSLDQLLEVSGIGPATLEAISSYLTL